MEGKRVVSLLRGQRQDKAAVVWETIKAIKASTDRRPLRSLSADGPAKTRILP